MLRQLFPVSTRTDSARCVRQVQLLILAHRRTTLTTEAGNVGVMDTPSGSRIHSHTIFYLSTSHHQDVLRLSTLVAAPILMERQNVHKCNSDRGLPLLAGLLHIDEGSLYRILKNRLCNM